MDFSTIFKRILKTTPSEEIINQNYRQMQARNNHKALSMAYEDSDLRKFTDFMGKVADLAKTPPLENAGDEKCP